ncbi:HK97 family phage prohead protease [Rhodobacter capsulatus]|uniref:HK97 family phage prohead protease n=1 Tax=Rhodobacter capsulatus TaxID=1061 RepID=UPI0040289353
MVIYSKSFSIKSFADGTDGTGTIEGYASTFGGAGDRTGDIIAPGAFKASIEAGIKPKMFWDHDKSQVIGVWDELSEDDHGLFVKGRFIDTEQSQYVRKLVVMGAIDAMSIGFFVKKATRNMDGTRTILETELFEISIVPIPINTEALITDAKSFDAYKSLDAAPDYTDDLNILNRHLSDLKSFLQKGK